MNIALLGYGKMGQEIERIAIRNGHKVILAIDSEADWKEMGQNLYLADVAIDFSMPEVTVANIRRCFAIHVPVVVGTTGWDNCYDEIRKECTETGSALFFSPNFSIGVNLFFEINRYLAKQMSPHTEYEISIEETHHIHKKDAPSGTAIKLANDIIENTERKEKWVREPSENPDELGIRSIRMENAPGTHVVRYDSENDTIEISHTAKSRRGFATGALMAASFLIGKKGCFEMKDLLSSDNLKNFK
ncbi:MAG: 4-hydroxy-tetrahydrodipicolinate reductase [Bacteroidota bacterium]|nr:4-hydroxy-tetrahydrodipicolinate reductase [Bacteroidota bacterium]